MLNSSPEKFKKNKFINIVDLFISISFVVEILCLIFMLFTSDEQIEIMLFINLYILFFIIIADLLIMGLNRHFPVFAFYCCFFIFLMGRKFIQCFSRDISTVYNAFSTKFIQTTLHGSDYLIFTSLLYFSLLITFIFYKLFFVKNIKKTEREDCNKKNRRELFKIQKAAQIMAYVTVIFAFIEKLIILKAQSNLSYVESYQTTVAVPAIIKIFNSLFEPSVFIYLATLPKKRPMWVILVLYVIVIGIMPVLNGNRAQFGIILLFAICYLLFYYKINKKRFRFRWLLYTVFCGLALICAFWFIEQIRDNKSVQDVSLFEIIEKILDSLGGSDSVIAGVIIKADQFPKSGVEYLFFPIKSAITDNPLMRLIIQLFTGQAIVTYPQGQEYLLHNDSFPHWFSYICSPQLYLSGSGSGSSYIAECFFAFGFFGVFIFSAILGIVIEKISHMELSNGSVYKNALGLFFLSYLFFLPRNSAFSFATQLIYFIAAILVCQILKTLLFDVCKSAPKKRCN